MQVSVENISSVERRLKIQVPAEEINKQIEARLREIGKQVRLKGFRPGRIPFSVLKQRYGPQAKQEVIQQTSENSLKQAVEKESLRIAANPRLEKAPELDKDSGLEISAVIEIYPEIASIDASEITIEVPIVSVTDDDVAEMMETLRRQRITWADVERKPKNGDQALLEYTAETDEGTLPETDKYRLAVILGESGFDDMEKAVEKMSAGDDKKVKMTFPADFSEPLLSGKAAEVSLTVTNVQESDLPVIDEDFIKSFGVASGDVEELKLEIRNNLERELGQAVSTQLKVQLVERLLEMHENLEVPESIVTNEAHGMLQNMLRGAKIEVTNEMLEHFREPARKRVRSGLLLGELAAQNSITIDGSKVREAIEEIAQTYEEPREVVQMYYNDQRMLQAVENSVLENQVVDWVVGTATVTDKPMSFHDAINAATEMAGK